MFTRTRAISPSRTESPTHFELRLRTSAIRHVLMIEHTRLEAQTWPEANEPMADAHSCRRKWRSSEASSRRERSDGCAARVSVLEVQIQVRSGMRRNFHAGLSDEANL